MSERDHDRGRTLYMAVFAAALTSAATTYGLRALESAPGGDAEASGDTVEVPSVVGLESDTGRELVQNRGLRWVVAAEAPSADHEPGTVSEQEPLAGSEVPAETAVNVTISTGAPRLDVPALVGRPLADARAELLRLGLVVGTVDETGEGASGAVTALDPPPGTEVDAGSTVNIVAAPAGITLEDYVGQNYRTVREALGELGLEVKIRRDFNENRADFVVLRQSPDAGTLLQPGDEVTLTIND